MATIEKAAQSLLLMASQDGGTDPRLAQTADSLSNLAHLNRSWPIRYAWAPVREREAALLLHELVGNDEAWTRHPPPRQLFLVSELIDVQPGPGKGLLELWRTRPVRFTGMRDTDLLRDVRALVVAESHVQGEAGWHFHPLTAQGKRLGYRMLFSSARSQSDLWWEQHGRGKLDYGDPAKEVLSRRRSEEYYKACLHMVRINSNFRHGEKYRVWSKRFVEAGNKTYLAHCASGQNSRPVNHSDHPQHA